MPPLRKHQSSVTTKLLLIGDSGGGKTGALASLASAGYNLRILDFDNGLDVLKNLLLDAKSPYDKDAIDRVQYLTITDPMRAVGGKLMPVRATVWTRTAAILSHWKDPDGADLGPVVSWGPGDILVIDSLTTLGTAAMDFILAMNGRLGQTPFQSDWKLAQDLLENLLRMLYDEGVKCNVIVNCHVTYIEAKNGMTQGYPNALGKALPPKVGRYFNSALMIRTIGQGAAQKRKILTNTSGLVELKNTAPLRVNNEYDIAFGLAEYFAAVRQQKEEPTPTIESKPTDKSNSPVIPLTKTQP